MRIENCAIGDFYFFSLFYCVLIIRILAFVFLSTDPFLHTKTAYCDVGTKVSVRRGRYRAGSTAGLIASGCRPPLLPTTGTCNDEAGHSLSSVILLAKGRLREVYSQFSILHSQFSPILACVFMANPESRRSASPRLDFARAFLYTGKSLKAERSRKL